MSYRIFVLLHSFFSFFSLLHACEWSPYQCGCAQTPPSITNRIIGGVEALPHSWPWIVSIRYFGRHTCGGVLISDRHVLTAAHCFPRYDPNLVSLYSFAMGHHDLTESNFVSPAERITIHPSYNYSGIGGHDIALVELRQTADFQNPQLGFICLPTSYESENDSFPSIGTETWVVGWGSMQYEGSAAPVLMQVAVPITNNSGCVNKVTIPSKQICAGYDAGGKDSCQGDSGGPLMLENDVGLFELVGLVSFGVRCGVAMKPGIYTRVSAFIDWIRTTIDDDLLQMSTNTSNIVATLHSSSIDYHSISSVLLLIEVVSLI